MGFYIRESISIGPVRFNLSKSGVGTSVGVEGFRLGAGPKGSYVHVGKGPVRYRKRLGSSKRQKSESGRQGRKEHPGRSQTQDGLGEVKDIDSAPASSLVDADSEEVVQQINDANGRMSLWPFVAVIVACTAYYALMQHQGGAVPSWVPVSTAIVGVIGLGLVHQRDQIRKNAALFYDFEESVQGRYEDVCECFTSASKSHRIWNLESRAQIKDKKRHAGGDNSVESNKTGIEFSTPGPVKTNIPVPSLPVGKQTLYFFPDRLLIEDDNGIGALSYDRVSVTEMETKFITEDAPDDATVVDHTWRYVNKDGSPDKRFSDNFRIPILKVEKLRLTSPEGLEEEILFSKNSAGREVAKALNTLESLSTG